ncbi:hypothetical protein AMJ86_05570 [bacterium SM23_57]|jgi:DUF971 family protein|nr:MAG: hypothetical protein AMJ86_05570 [bacterium SM23_57]
MDWEDNDYYFWELFVKNSPSGINVNRYSSILTIQWKDGHVSEYTFSLIRNACPCVECRGGHDQMSDRPAPDVFNLPQELSNRTRLVDVFPVGSYALRIQWEDGHNAGIYHWDLLRHLCPCSECRSSGFYQTENT